MMSSIPTDQPQRPRPMGFPVGNDPQAILQRIELMERVLEGGFVIPGVNFRVGFDAVAGVIPVVGDFIAAAMGGYIVWEAKNLGLPKWKLWRMAGNVAFDTAIGAIPVVGDMFDVFFRSNTRNLRIVRKHLDKRYPLIEQ